MSWIAAGIAGGTAILKGVEGLSQKHQASQIDKNNPYPTYTVPQEYQENVNQAQNMSQVGLPQQQYNNQLNNISQNQSAGISELNNSANPGANIASVVRAGDNATGALNAQDAVARNNNMLQLLKQRQVLAQQKDKAWDWNYQQKYLGNLAKSQALQGAGNANINGALNDASSGASTLLKMQTPSTSWESPTAATNAAADMQYSNGLQNISGIEQGFNRYLASKN